LVAIFIFKGLSHPPSQSPPFPKGRGEKVIVFPPPPLEGKLLFNFLPRRNFASKNQGCSNY